MEKRTKIDLFYIRKRTKFNFKKLCFIKFRAFLKVLSNLY